MYKRTKTHFKLENKQTTDKRRDGNETQGQRDEMMNETNKQTKKEMGKKRRYRQTKRVDPNMEG